jgi:hypothetical protein
MMIHVRICDKIPSTFEFPASNYNKRLICRFNIKAGISPTYWLFSVTHYGLSPKFSANFGAAGCEFKIWPSFTSSIN